MTAVQPQTDQITLTIDGFEVTVPKGTLVIRAAEQLGIQVPRLYNHAIFNGNSARSLRLWKCTTIDLDINQTLTTGANW